MDALVYSTTSLSTSFYSFHNLSTLQCHMIYHIQSHNYFSSKKILYHTHKHMHTHTYTHRHTLFQRSLSLQTLLSNLHLHLHVPCHSVYLVSLVLDIKLNTLMFIFYITSGIHNFSNGSLILLQLRLHLLFLML